VRGAIARLILAGIFILAPLSTLAEGAMRVLECSFDQLCDSRANCKPASGAVVFNMEPLKLDDNGAGSYEVSYADNKLEMEAMSFAGPFFWNTEGEMHTLLANSESRFLWHRLNLSSKPEANMQFLHCTFTQ
jgi:hypothetical protein